MVSNVFNIEISMSFHPNYQFQFKYNDKEATDIAITIFNNSWYTLGVYSQDTTNIYKMFTVYRHHFSHP